MITLDKESISKAIGRLDLVSAVGIKDFNLIKKLKENKTIEEIFALVNKDIILDEM